MMVPVFSGTAGEEQFTWLATNLEIDTMLEEK
jgi:hypothetical protein